MKNNNLYFFIILLITHISVGYAQQNIVCKGKITDVNTNLPLQEVKIFKVFNGDTVMYQSNATGDFQISLQSGSKLLLRKPGYAWKTVRVSNDEILQIKLTPSKPQNPTIHNTKEDKIYEADVYINGQLVPKSEVNDALSLDPKEITNLSTRTNKVTGRGEMHIETK